MKIKSNSIVSADGNSGVEFSYGVSYPNELNIQGNVNLNLSGVSTIGFLTVTSGVNISGVVTASSFVGDGSGLTGVPSISASKSIALKYIISDPPLRS